MGDTAPRSQIVDELLMVAPEIEPDELADSVALRDQIDLDSMDWLNFLIRVSKRFAVDIPESAHASLRTIDDLTRYVDTHR
ncbi:acyl carrier protein [Mycolicibacterium sp. BK556]|uniref:acyl carrier protein n=1 Tax=Mycobacteriaceae TaxID=1762 RepID=UPI00105CA394|nr:MULTISPECIES: acyl carrier protein [Mycobacteriaceae]MBB3604442.1 acyl carrier protein [Mycolicibacterium sp. BK556]MBB3634845.1 acyl carrier protein [Mycolicibacterium sp. BK607]TDO17349.1 acyl carrier protein [Mycobacterium sp. BK086]